MELRGAQVTTGVCVFITGASRWSECMKSLEIRQPTLKIPWDSLAYIGSEVVVQCKEMMELPEAMAYYIQSSLLSRARWKLGPQISLEGALETLEMYALNKCIVPPPRHNKSRAGYNVEHVLCYNVMTIKHPTICNYSIKLRAHPFR